MSPSVTAIFICLLCSAECDGNDARPRPGGGKPGRDKVADGGLYLGGGGNAWKLFFSGGRGGSEGKPAAPRIPATGIMPSGAPCVKGSMDGGGGGGNAMPGGGGTAGMFGHRGTAAGNAKSAGPPEKPCGAIIPGGMGRA